MKKIKLYPKTKRIDFRSRIQLTEKLDGSNLTFFKYSQDTHELLYIAQRNFVYSLNEIDDEEVKEIMYKGLHGWLKTNGEVLESLMQPNASISGEWLGMGSIAYNFPLKFYMYAKGNVYGDDLTLVNLNYRHDLFKYSFVGQEIPYFIGTVPVVVNLETKPTLEQLDELYEKYVDDTGRKIEGFVINDDNKITKYVRLKRGVLQKHFNWK